MTEETTNEATVEKTDAVVENVEVAPEADAKADTIEVATEEITEKAAKAKAHPDKESPAEDAAEPADAEAMEEKKPAKKSDEVVVESITEVKDIVTTAFSDLVSTVKALQAEVEMLKSTKVDVEVVKESFDAVAKDIAATKEYYNEFGKRVDAVEAETAFRKSGDLGEIVQDQPEVVEKSLWGGSFLKTADLFK